MAPKREIRLIAAYPRKEPLMEIKIDNDTYRVISTKPISESDINKIKDAILLREAQKTQKPKTSTKKFCVVIKK